VRALLFFVALGSIARADLDVPGAVEGRRAFDRCQAVFDDLRRDLESGSARVRATSSTDSTQLIVTPPKWDGAPEFRAGASFGSTGIRTFVSPPRILVLRTSGALRGVYMARKQCAGEALIQYSEDFMYDPIFTLPDGWRVVHGWTRDGPARGGLLDRFVDERGQQRLRRLFPPDAPRYPEAEYDWLRSEVIGRWLVTYGVRRGEFRFHLTDAKVSRDVGVLFYGAARETDVLVKLLRSVR
jgi:hypothetical protein